MRVALLLAAVACAAGHQPWTASMKHFGHSIKNGAISEGQEVTVFEYSCNDPPCAITQMQVPSIYPASGQPWDWEHGILSFSIDGNNNFSMSLLEMAFEGYNGAQGTGAADGSPWGLSTFGKTAKTGGVYSTLRIPFSASIKITLRMSPQAKGTNTYWFVVRGLTSYRVTLGDVILPANAKLNIQRFGPQQVQPYQLIPMLNISSDANGALVGVVLNSVSTDYTYLEACMRLVDANGEVSFLSSGGEDYFMSSAYFDEGMFKTENSGLTFFDGKGSLSAYKVHTRDFLPLMPSDSLVFRVGEKTGGCGSLGACPDQYCSSQEPKEHVHHEDVKMSNNITYSTMVVYYTWSAQQEHGGQRSFVDYLFQAADSGYLTEAEVASVMDKPSIKEHAQEYLAACGATCFRAANDKKSRLAALMIRKLL